MTDSPQPFLKRPLVRLGLVAAGAAVATALVMALFANINTRKAEALQTSLRLVDLDETTVDPAIWGKNFPRQFDSYQRTIEPYHTKYGGAGSEGVPTSSKLEQDPMLKTIFAGYAFAIDYNHRRGHAYMLEDQKMTKRVTERPQSGACMHCHASNVVLYRELGLKKGAPGDLKEPLSSSNAQAQLQAGFEATCAMTYQEVGPLAKHPVACLDCHDPKTMALRVTKPGFIKGIDALARSNDSVPHLFFIERWRREGKKGTYDANTMASRQEMRSMVCGQCHVEYYCGPKATLFFPWHNGLKIEQVEAYYNDYKWKDGTRFSDYKHAISGAEVIKAQHPEFEMWSQGVHSRAGVSCSDCHMPYVRDGALKVSSHHVQSPLRDITRSCQPCHRVPADELKARVETIQDRTHALMMRAETAVVALIHDLEAAKKAGLNDAALKEIHEFQRKAQWRVDYVNAENSMGFHAPQEAARILGEAVDYARQGQIELRRLVDPAKLPTLARK